jgi:hypothetical protein
VDAFPGCLYSTIDTGLCATSDTERGCRTRNRNGPK